MTWKCQRFLDKHRRHFSVDYDENMAVASYTEPAEWMQARPAGYEPSWNLKLTQPIPAAFSDHKDGTKRLEYAYWSLVPIWSKELKTKFPTFNARSETAAEKASVKNRRCVIPVTGFYEWTGAKSVRIPHAIFGPDPIIPMAGL